MNNIGEPNKLFKILDNGEFKEINIRNALETNGLGTGAAVADIDGDCGTMKKGKPTQRCLPLAKARSLTKKQRAATSRKKTRSKKQFVKNTKAAKVRLKK